MRILVLGGTGAIGIYLIPALVAEGFKVTVTSRGGREFDHAAYRDVCIKLGDAKNTDWLKKLLSNGRFDTIIDFMNYGTHEFNVRYKLLLEKTGHYIFLSSYRVYADHGMNPLTENSLRLLDTCTDKAYLATDEYSLAKARQEDLLKASSRKNWTIVRPGITYSERRFQLGTLELDTICFRALQGVPVGLPEEILSCQTTMTWAGDVAAMISRLALQLSAHENDFNVVSSETIRWDKVAKIYESEIGLQTKVIPLKTYLGIVRNQYQVRYDRMYHRLMDNSKVLNYSGLHQSDFMHVKDALASELRKFAANPVYSHIDYEVNGRIDKALNCSINVQTLTPGERASYMRGRAPKVYRLRDFGIRAKRLLRLTRRH